MSANQIIECTNFANKIAQKVYKDLASKINEEIEEKESIYVSEMCKYGNMRILQETESVYKKCKNKGIGFPVSISLNNCVGNYVETETETETLMIKKGDVIKVELGVIIDGYLSIVGETFVAGGGLEKELKFLDELSSEIVLREGDTNDVFRMFIESECTKNGMYPIENCTSYQQYQNHIKTDESKYMILNYRKYWDEDDNLVSEENLCFEFEENEVYTINITCALSESVNLKYKELIEPRLSRFNETNYQLKLNSARAFLNEVKAKYRNNVFNITEFFDNPKMKVGMKECFGSGILESFPIFHLFEETTPIPVIHKKFTVIVKKARVQM